MDSKLTLKLDQAIIEKAKAYAAEKKISLSRLIEAYLNAVTTEKAASEIEISPFVKSMSTGKSMPIDLDYKSEYSNHLTEKYK